jgi:MFS family permease
MSRSTRPLTALASLASLRSLLATLAAQYGSLGHLRDRRVALLAGAHCLDLASGSLVVPLLPVYADRLGADALALGLLFALPTAANAALATPCGRLADRVGRAPLVVAGLAVGALATAGVGLVGVAPGLVAGVPLVAGAGPVAALLALRALDGVGRAVAGPAASSYLGDHAADDERAGVLGAHRTAGMIGVALGPALGGLLAARAGLAAPFLVLGGVTLAAALVLAVRLPSATTPTRDDGPDAASLPTRLRAATATRVRAALAAVCDARSSLDAGPVLAGRERVPSPASLRARLSVPTALLLASAFLGNLGTTALEPLFAPLLAATVDAGPTYVGTVWSVLGATMALAMPVGGTLGDRLPRVPTLVATKLAWAGVVAGLALLHVRAAPLALFALGGLASALAAPATGALNYDVAPDGDEGAFLGAVSTAYAVGGAAGPLLGGAVAGLLGVRAAALAVAALWLANALVLLPVRGWE